MGSSLAKSWPGTWPLHKTPFYLLWTCAWTNSGLFCLLIFCVLWSFWTFSGLSSKIVAFMAKFLFPCGLYASGDCHMLQCLPKHTMGGTCIPTHFCDGHPQSSQGGPVPFQGLLLQGHNMLGFIFILAPHAAAS